MQQPFSESLQGSGGICPRRVVLGVTGASGSIYAQNLLVRLLKAEVPVYVVFTDTAEKVVSTELGHSLLQVLANAQQLQRFESYEPLVNMTKTLGLSASLLAKLKKFHNDDLYAPIASGSLGATHMVLCPASMGSMARIANGISSNLIERAADVMLKEQRSLCIVPRETPLSLIHLQNMLTLRQAGAAIVPAMPAFYMQPKSINDLVEFVVDRICDILRIPELEGLKSVAWNPTRF